MNKSTHKTMVRTYVLGTGESKHLDRESRQECRGEVNELNLPRRRSAFQRAEVTIDHKNNKVC